MGTTLGTQKIMPDKNKKVSVDRKKSSTNTVVDVDGPTSNMQIFRSFPTDDASTSSASHVTTDVADSEIKRAMDKHPRKLPPIGNRVSSFARRKSSVENVISEYGLTEEKISEYKNAFRLFDRNDDGRITEQELGMVMRSLNQVPNEHELKSMVNNVDEDGNGTIEFDEFLQMMMSRVKAKDDNNSLAEAFEVFDKNRDGFISAQEIRSVVTSLGENLSDQELEDMIKMADTNGDGKINFEEFRNVWDMFGR